MYYLFASKLRQLCPEFILNKCLKKKSELHGAGALSLNISLKDQVLCGRFSGLVNLMIPVNQVASEPVKLPTLAKLFKYLFGCDTTVVRTM